MINRRSRLLRQHIIVTILYACHRNSPFTKTFPMQHSELSSEGDAYAMSATDWRVWTSNPGVWAARMELYRKKEDYVLAADAARACIELCGGLLPMSSMDYGFGSGIASLKVIAEVCCWGCDAELCAEATGMIMDMMPIDASVNELSKWTPAAEERRHAEISAATKLQSLFRGHVARMNIKAASREFQRKHVAAVEIQRIVRGRLGRVAALNEQRRRRRIIQATARMLAERQAANAKAILRAWARRAAGQAGAKDLVRERQNRVMKSHVKCWRVVVIEKVVRSD